MTRVSDPNVLKACQEPELLEKFQNSNSELEKVKKSLEDYLEKKRQLFARFYFLADEELFEIMSQSKEIETIRPYLKGCLKTYLILDIRDRKKSHHDHDLIRGRGGRVRSAGRHKPEANGILDGRYGKVHERERA